MDAAVAQIILHDRNIAYVVTDRTLRVVEVSGAPQILRGDGGGVLGRPLTELVPELVGSEDALEDILLGELPRFELPLVNRESHDGQTLYLTMVDLPYRDRADRIMGLMHLIEDVTGMGGLEQRLTQQRNELRFLRDELQHQNLKLVAANSELQRLDEVKSLFVSVAAHELRSPLTSISGYVEMLLDDEFGKLTDVQRGPLETLYISARRLLEITNNLLDVTRIETGRIELILQPTDLTTLVETVAEEYAPQLRAKGQRLTLQAAPDLPLALCDRTRAAQIIGNLLGNAVKFTGRGGLITVRVNRAATADDLEVAVTDNGVGIAAEDLPRLGARFFRAGSAQVTGANGAGLGLYITNSLVELHGGRIWFTSALDQGTTVYVIFPGAGSQSP
ncbi:MAG: ATP-binding protein [Chloroflexi bacterium]|nr:ATP-binding protein [Chloroflexota bacterium]